MSVETNRIERINFSIENSQSISLARYVLLLEEEYKSLLEKDCGVDVEWAIDGNDNEIYILNTGSRTASPLNQNLNLLLTNSINSLSLN